jgi:signal transduction histidine kinase
MGRLLPDQQESQAAIEDVRGALAGRPLRRIEYAITRKDGGRRTVELHVAPFPEGVVAEMIDVTGRRRLERELMDVGADLQRRIGQDLHDGLGQMLTGVAFQARALEKRLARLCPQETPKAAAILSLVNDAISQTRALARGLSPVDVAEEGLMGALETCAANVQALTGIRCTFECPEPVPVADNDVATHLYHIAQEAATNAARHAHAANIVIGLSQRDGSMHLTVRDDGVGPPQNLGETPGLGLKIMGYRARMIGAGFEVTRNEGGGTTVLCVLDRPIRQNGKGRKQ